MERIPDESHRSGFVAVVGRPNVGKSTLVNRLVGQKVTIVSDKPQTTRNRIAGVVNRPGAQIVLIDTPGVQRPRNRLGQHMARATRMALEEVDLALLLVDATQPAPGSGDRYLAGLVEECGAPGLLVLNKSDLVSPGRLSERSAAYAVLGDFPQVPVSALTGDNTDGLAKLIVERLPEGPRYFPEDMVTDRPLQFLTAELIREKILDLTREEVPHGTAVQVEEWTERDNGTVYIAANVYVEKESHKAIIIGKSGSMLAEVGRRARKSIEAILGQHVYLDLWVKVKVNWRDTEGSLQDLGLDPRR